MKSSFLRGVVFVVLSGFCAIASASGVVYNVNTFAGDYDITGTITTDGRIGELTGIGGALQGITAWDFSIYNPITSALTNISNTAPNANAQCYGAGCGIAISGSAMTIDMPSSGDQITFSSSIGLIGVTWYLTSPAIIYDNSTSVLGITSVPNGTVFATAAPVPEPGEWLLMLSGFGLIGFITKRRKLIAA